MMLRCDEDGWEEIVCTGGNRHGLWIRLGLNGFEICAGKDGDDVYLSLVTGAKGIIVFSGWNNRPGFKEQFQNFYDGYIATAKELNGTPDLGNVFLRGQKTNSVSR